MMRFFPKRAKTFEDRITVERRKMRDKYNRDSWIERSEIAELKRKIRERDNDDDDW
jgi:hypothetical protein